MTATRHQAARRYSETYQGTVAFAFIKDGRGAVHVKPASGSGPANSRHVGKVERVGGMWQATRAKGAVDSFLGSYQALNRALFRFASDEADRLHREREAAKVQGDGTVLDTFPMVRLTHDDVRALLTQPMGNRRILVSSVWNDWRSLSEWRLTALDEPRFPGNAPTLRGVTLDDPRAWVPWDTAVRVYLAEQPKKD